MDWIKEKIIHYLEKGDKHAMVAQRHVYASLREVSSDLTMISQTFTCSVAQSCLPVTPWTAECEASLSFTISQSLL